MKRLLLVLVGFVAALSLTSVALATPTQNWWSSDHAEAAIMDSDWAFTHGVADTSCAGWGVARIDSMSGQSTFRRFVCTAYAEQDEVTCLPGECDSTTVGLTCTYKLRIQTTGAESFLIVGVRSTC